MRDIRIHLDYPSTGTVKTRPSHFKRAGTDQGANRAVKKAF